MLFRVIGRVHLSYREIPGMKWSDDVLALECGHWVVRKRDESHKHTRARCDMGCTTSRIPKHG